MSSQATTYVKSITSSLQKQFLKCLEHAVSYAKIATKLNEIVIKHTRENKISNKYGASVCPTQTIHLPPSRGHFSLVTKEVKAIVMELCWLCPRNEM